MFLSAPSVLVCKPHTGLLGTGPRYEVTIWDRVAERRVYLKAGRHFNAQCLDARSVSPNWYGGELMVSTRLSSKEVIESLQKYGYLPPQVEVTWEE